MSKTSHHKKNYGVDQLQAFSKKEKKNFKKAELAGDFIENGIADEITNEIKKFNNTFTNKNIWLYEFWCS